MSNLPQQNDSFPLSADTLFLSFQVSLGTTPSHLRPASRGWGVTSIAIAPSTPKVVWLSRTLLRHVSASLYARLWVRDQWE